jgi:hypothetical protein
VPTREYIDRIRKLASPLVHIHGGFTDQTHSQRFQLYLSGRGLIFNISPISDEQQLLSRRN